MKFQDRVKNITNVLDSKKAEDVDAIDMKESEYIFDTVIIATILNTKHGLGMLNHLKEELKPKGEEFLAIDEGDGWIVVDLGDILIHLMSLEYRNNYKIEQFLAEVKLKQDSI
jgi:ribosome silencing factor RsfS/YbeB/iojap